MAVLDIDKARALATLSPEAQAMIERDKATVVSEKNREALHSLHPLIRSAIQHNASEQLTAALVKKALEPDSPHRWKYDIETAMRVLDNFADGYFCVKAAEDIAASRVEFLRMMAESTDCDMWLRPL